LFANGCFNPIAMFAVSKTFRKLLLTWNIHLTMGCTAQGCKELLFVT
jgi:hypothetical protein